MRRCTVSSGRVGGRPPTTVSRWLPSCAAAETTTGHHHPISSPTAACLAGMAHTEAPCIQEDMWPCAFRSGPLKASCRKRSGETADPTARPVPRPSGATLSPPFVPPCSPGRHVQPQRISKEHDGPLSSPVGASGRPLSKRSGTRCNRSRNLGCHPDIIQSSSQGWYQPPRAYRKSHHAIQKSRGRVRCGREPLKASGCKRSAWLTIRCPPAARERVPPPIRPPRTSRSS